MSALNNHLDAYFIIYLQVQRLPVAHLQVQSFPDARLHVQNLSFAQLQIQAPKHLRTYLVYLSATRTNLNIVSGSIFQVSLKIRHSIEN